LFVDRGLAHLRDTFGAFKDIFSNPKHELFHLHLAISKFTCFFSRFDRFFYVFARFRVFEKQFTPEKHNELVTLGSFLEMEISDLDGVQWFSYKAAGLVCAKPMLYVARQHFNHNCYKQIKVLASCYVADVLSLSQAAQQRDSNECCTTTKHPFSLTDQQASDSE